MTSIRKMKRRQVYHHIEVRRVAVKVNDVLERLCREFPNVRRLNDYPETPPGYYSGVQTGRYTSKVYVPRINDQPFYEHAISRLKRVQEQVRKDAYVGAVDRIVNAVLKANIWEGQYTMITGQEYARRVMQGWKVDNMVAAESVLLVTNEATYNEIYFFTEGNHIYFWVK